MSRQLLFSITKKDLDISFFSGSGAGGQHRNKHQNCVRMTHRDSGASSVGQSSRSREHNLKEAFLNLKDNAKFKLWYNLKILEAIEGQTLEEKVEEAMTPSNLKVESKVDGRWQEL